MEQAAKDGLIRSPISVYTELAKCQDQLSRWAARMRSRLFVRPDRHVQQCFGQIASLVQSAYEPPYSAKFLDGADPWVIAHALDGKGTVVTHEISVASNSKEVKIPNVCDRVGVQCIDPYSAFRKLGLRL